MPTRAAPGSCRTSQILSNSAWLSSAFSCLRGWSDVKYSSSMFLYCAREGMPRSAEDGSDSPGRNDDGVNRESSWVGFLGFLIVVPFLL